MAWDPATGNNNDYFPTYDSAHSEMNWPFLNQQGITQDNYKQTFLPWMTNTQTIQVDGGPVTGIPGEWNYFGGNGCYFVNYQDKHSLISGGALEFGKTITSDPLIGKPIVLAGNPFGDPTKFSPGRLVDVNPASSYTSQIYFSNFAVGDAATGINGPRAFRMYSRFANYQRNSGLPVAGGMSVVWQTCIPRRAAQAQQLPGLQIARRFQAGSRRQGRQGPDDPVLQLSQPVHAERHLQRLHAPAALEQRPAPALSAGPEQPDRFLFQPLL